MPRGSQRLQNTAAIVCVIAMGVIADSVWWWSILLGLSLVGYLIYKNHGDTTAQSPCEIARHDCLGSV